MFQKNPKLLEAVKSKNSLDGVLYIVEKEMPDKYNVFKEWVEATKDGIFDSNKYIAEIADGADEGAKRNSHKQETLQVKFMIKYYPHFKQVLS